MAQVYRSVDKRWKNLCTSRRPADWLPLENEQLASVCCKKTMERYQQLKNMYQFLNNNDDELFVNYPRYNKLNKIKNKFVNMHHQFQILKGDFIWCINEANLSTATRDEFQNLAEDCVRKANHLAFRSYQVIKCLFEKFPFTKENGFNERSYEYFKNLLDVKDSIILDNGVDEVDIIL